MTTSSVSFRITRQSEDLAQTIHALSHRLIQLEQRLATLEDQLLMSQEEAPSSEHLASLANVDQLLHDCRELLAEKAPEEVDVPGNSRSTAVSIQAFADLDEDSTGDIPPLESLEQAA